jgi:hypothetical protein
MQISLRWLLAWVAVVGVSLWAAIQWQRTRTAPRREFYLQIASQIAAEEDYYSDLASKLIGHAPKRPRDTIVDLVFPDHTFIRFTPDVHAPSCSGVHAVSLGLMGHLHDGTIIRHRYSGEPPCPYPIPESYRQAGEETKQRLIARCEQWADRLNDLRRRFDRAAEVLWPSENPDAPFMEWEEWKTEARRARSAAAW